MERIAALFKRAWIDTAFGGMNNVIGFGNNSLQYNTVFTAERREALALPASYIATEYTPDFSNGPRQFRISTMQSKALQEGQAMTAQEVWNLFYPAIILAIILVFISGIMVPIGIYMCAKIHPALTKGFVEKPKDWSKPWSWKRHLLPVLIILAAFAFWVWSLILIFHGTNEFTSNLNIAKSAGEDLLSLATVKLLGIGPVGNFMIQDLNKTITGAVSGLRKDIDVNNIATAIDPEIKSISADFGRAKVALDLTNKNVSGLDTAWRAENASYQALVPAANAWADKTKKQLNVDQPFPSGDGTYRLNPPLALPDQTITTPPNVRNATEELLKTLNEGTNSVTQTLAKAESAFAGYNSTQFTQTVEKAVNESVVGAQEVLQPKVQAAIQQLQAVYNSTLAPFNVYVNSAAEQFTNVFNFLLKIDGARNVLTIIAGVLSAIAMIVVLAAMFARSPRWTGHCLLASLAFGIICLIVGALYLAISVSIGAACGAIEQDNLKALIPTINQVAGTNIVPAYVDAFRLARSECAKGVNGVQVGIDTIQALQAAGVNVPVDQATLGNFERAVNNIAAAATDNQTIANALKNVGDRIPRAINAGIELAQAGVQAAQDAARIALRQVTKPLLSQATTEPYTPAMRAGVATLDGLAKTGGTVGKAISSDPARVAEAETLLNTQASILDKEWQGIDSKEGAALRTSQADVANYAKGADTSLADFDNDMTLLQGDIDKLANETYTAVQKEMNDFETNGLVSVQQSFQSFSKSAVGLVGGLTACTEIIQDTYVIQNAVCIGVSRAADELWLGFLITGFLWTVGTILMFYALKKVWGTDPEWRWKGRKAPMAAAEADKYALNEKQMLSNVAHEDAHGADWNVVAEKTGMEVNGASLTVSSNGEATSITMPTSATLSAPATEMTPAVSVSAQGGQLSVDAKV